MLSTSVSSVVKLQFKLNSSVQVGQGVDFVFPLSQQEEQQEQEQEEPSPKSTTSRHTRRYVDLTHKYKVIQGVKTKLNPFPQGGGLKSYFPFKRVLGSVRGSDLVCILL